MPTTVPPIVPAIRALTSLDISCNKFVSECYQFVYSDVGAAIKVGDIMDGNPVIARRDDNVGGLIVTILRLDELDGVKALADIVCRNVALTTGLHHLSYLNLSCTSVLAESVPHVAKVVAPAMRAARDRVLAAVLSEGLATRVALLGVIPTTTTADARDDDLATVFAPLFVGLRPLTAMLEAFAPCRHSIHMDDARRRLLSAPYPFARVPGALWARIGQFFFAAD